MNDVCLYILCPPSVEENLLDLLLVMPDEVVFTRQIVAAHGVAFGELSQSEQVLGRASAVEIKVLCTQVLLDEIIGMLGQRFQAVGLRYWTLAIQEAGEIR